MGTTRGRQVFANQPIIDQADFFQSDGFTRVTGLVPSNLTSQLFFDNMLQPWPLVTGQNITDQQIVSGSIYWVEVAGSPGIYSVRFRPNATGYWRLLITYPLGTQISGQDYDVFPYTGSSPGGLSTSFIKPEC